jgi:hypothetical protein
VAFEALLDPLQLTPLWRAHHTNAAIQPSGVVAVASSRDCGTVLIIDGFDFGSNEIRNLDRACCRTANTACAISGSAEQFLSVGKSVG